MKRLLAIGSGMVAAGWGIYAMGGHALASAMAARFEKAILRMGEGKITDTSSFVHHRLFEGLWLATLLLAWWGIHAAVVKWRSNKGKVPSWRWAWVVHSSLALICLNLWLSQAE